jgi:adenylate kinase family enzyme
MRDASIASVRVNVLGASGCGATTLGRSLAAALSLPYYDGDDYFHGPSDPPFQNPRSPEERYALITADLRPTESWVLAGGVAAWEPEPRLDFTCVTFLFVPTDVRIERLRRRERERFGDRILEGGDMHATHEAFLEWASRYDVGDVEGKTLARHEAFLAKQTCPVLRFDGERPVSEIRDDVMRALGRT